MSNKYHRNILSVTHSFHHVLCTHYYSYGENMQINQTMHIRVGWRGGKRGKWETFNTVNNEEIFIKNNIYQLWLNNVMKERKREVRGKENQIPYQRGTHTLKWGNSKKGRAKAKGNALQ